MLKEIAVKTRHVTGKTRLSATDFMDDGSVIQLDIDINENTVTTALSLIFLLCSMNQDLPNSGLLFKLLRPLYET